MLDTKKRLRTLVRPYLERAMRIEGHAITVMRGELLADPA